MRRALLLTACLALPFPLSAAEEAPPAAPAAAVQPAPEVEPELSEKDRKDLEKALGKDTAAESKPQKGATPVATSAAPTGTFSFQSFNPDLSFIADFALAAFSNEKQLQTGDHDPRRNGFNLQQLELAVGAAVDPFLRFDANLVFHPDGVEIEEAYATSLALPAQLQLRAGQFLTRFGRLNNTHPHTWSFVDQPFILGRYFGGEGNRGLGVEGSWLAPLPWFVELVLSETEAFGEGTARSFMGASTLPVQSPLDFQTTAAVKQFFDLSQDLSLLFGLSYAGAPNSTGFRNRTDLFGTDLYLKFKPVDSTDFTTVSLQAELLYRRRQVPDEVLSDYGAYAQLLYRFSRTWALAARYEYGSPTRTRDGAIVGDDLDPLWTGNRERVSANVTWGPTEFTRLRLQGQTDRPSFSPKYYAAFLSFEVAVGAHGAHAF